MKRSLILILGLYSCSKHAATSTPAQATPPVDPIEQAVQRRDMYMSKLHLGELPHGDEYKPEYFEKLKQRKASVIAWAERAHPTIIFVGQIHASVAGNTSPARLAEIKRLQNILYDDLVHLSKDADLFTIEDYGTDERLTPDVFFRNAIKNIEGIHQLFPKFPIPTSATIERIARNDFQAITRAILSISETPIYNGEEWPNALESFVLMTLDAMPEELKPIALDFCDDFNDLRSQIIVIRTLEFLRAAHGTRAVIVQGTQHGPTISAHSAEYHIQLEMHMPPGE